jgi:hypothetical protein
MCVSFFCTTFVRNTFRSDNYIYRVVLDMSPEMHIDLRVKCGIFTAEVMRSTTGI